MTTSRRVYRNPPIIEALCEFRFSPSEAGWNPTFPVRIFDELSDDYPGTPVQHLALDPSAPGPIAPGEPGLAFPPPEITPRFQLRDEARTRLVTISPDTLSVSVLSPYPGWEDFRPRILAALETFVAVTRADAILRIGIRYINRIGLPGQDVNLDDYFAIGPRQPPGLPQNINSFVSRQELAYDEDSGLILTFASAPPTPEDPRPQVVLDLDVIRSWDPAAPLRASAVPSVLDPLRERERIAFEACLTPATRELFDAA